MTEYEVHPVADLFPMLADDELSELAADIAERGLLHPIVLDGDGQVLDGRNRLAACERAGIQPEFETYDGEDPGGYALAVNVARRNLLPKQRYLVVEKARRLTKTTKSQFPEPERLSEAAVVLDWAPDLAEQIIAGAGPSLGDAATEARARKQKAQEIEAEKRRLGKKAPDLAALVGEERMSLDDATAALDAREEKAREERDERERQRQEREAEAEDARRRFTDSLGKSIVSLWALLDPDPGKAVNEHWRREHSVHIGLPHQAERFTSHGIRALAVLLGDLADYLVGEDGEDGSL